MCDVMEKYTKEAVERGREEERLNMAKKLVALNSMAVDDIAKITNLEYEKVLKLFDEMSV